MEEPHKYDRYSLENGVMLCRHKLDCGASLAANLSGADSAGHFQMTPEGTVQWAHHAIGGVHAGSSCTHGANTIADIDKAQKLDKL